jgi:hypothetical protein
MFKLQSDDTTMLKCDNCTRFLYKAMGWYKMDKHFCSKDCMNIWLKTYWEKVTAQSWARFKAEEERVNDARPDGSGVC